MLRFFVVFALFHATISSLPCEEGVPIYLDEVENIQELIGNWTYLYHWYKDEIIKELHLKDTPPSHCVEMSFTPVSPDYVKAEEAACKDAKIPFNWSDAKLRVDSPKIKIDGGIITEGEKEDWFVVDCKNMARLHLAKVSDDYMILLNPDKRYVAELIGKTVPTREELNCVVNNIEITEGTKGVALCYKN